MARNSASKRSKHEDLSARVGVWIEKVEEKVYDLDGQKLSNVDILLRQTYKRATEGDIPAIKRMLQVINANLEERAARQREIRRQGWVEPFRPANADMALMLLGIAVPSNNVLAGEPAGPTYEICMKRLKPDRLARWVVEAAMSAPDAPTFDRWEREAIERNCAADDGSDITEWSENKANLICDLVRSRGPESTRFKPGKSGNRRGRPRKKLEDFPYDNFLMEPTIIWLNGKEQTMTRFDALMCKLTNEAAKGKTRLSNIIMDLVMRYREVKWKKHMPIGEIVRG